MSRSAVLRLCSLVVNGRMGSLNWSKLLGFELGECLFLGTPNDQVFHAAWWKSHVCLSHQTICFSPHGSYVGQKGRKSWCLPCTDTNFTSSNVGILCMCYYKKIILGICLSPFYSPLVVLADLFGENVYFWIYIKVCIPWLCDWL